MPAGGFTASKTPVMASAGISTATTQVVRRGPGGRGAKAVAANLERLVLVFAARAPDPRTDASDATAWLSGPRHAPSRTTHSQS